MNNFLELKDQLKEFAPKLKTIISKDIKIEEFIRITLLSTQNNPALLNCDRASFFDALIACASDGLMPNGKEAVFLIMRNKNSPKSKVTYIPMIAGLLKKIYQSEKIISIGAFICYEGDHFKYQITENGESIQYERLFKSQDLKLTFAIAKTIHNEKFCEILEKNELDKIQKMSKAQNFGPWKEWYSEMAKKSVIKRLCKRLPLNQKIENLLLRDNEIYEFETQNQNSKNEKVMSLLKNDKIEKKH